MNASDNTLPVLLAVEGPVAHITLNRPEVMNTLDSAMAEALNRVLNQVAEDRAVRVALLEGAGGQFMAGGDLGYFAASLKQPPEVRQAGIEAAFAEVNQAVATLRAMPQPVIAVVQGAAAGFGLSLVAACDLALAADNAYFSLAYRNVGLTPDGGSTYHLVRQLGSKQMMEIALLAERFDAHRALELGLVNRVVPEADLAAEAQVWAQKLAMGPAQAQAQTKALINRAQGQALVEQLEAEKQAFIGQLNHPEFIEGVQAFFQKRVPKFAENHKIGC